MRRSFDGLERMTREIIRENPLSGHLFVFRNKKGDRVKVLYWENGGFVIHYKLLERGRFRLPDHDGARSLRITSTQLMMMLQGADLRAVVQPRWWSPSPAAVAAR
jgi:transposase